MKPNFIHSTSTRQFLYVIAFLLCAFTGYTQQKEIELADEYFSMNDFAKANTIYGKYVLKDGYQQKIYENYRISEVRLKQYNSLFKTLKKLNKKQPSNYLYLVDLLGVEKLAGYAKDYSKDYKKLYNAVKDDAYTLYQVAQHLEARKMYDVYIELLLEVRKHKKDNTLYAQELISIYQITGNTSSLIDESLLYLRYNPQELEAIENLFQSDFSITDYVVLEEKLFEKLGKDDHYTYRQLLVWYYIQQNDFYSAFVQQRSIDIAKRERGYGLLELAEITTSNEAYPQAIEILEYTCEKYKQQEIYVKAKTRLIEVKELLVKDDFPVDTAQINQLLTDYTELLITARNHDEKARIEQNIASLYAFYLHDNKKAIDLLAKLTSTPGISRNRKASALLLLGDVYLLDDQIGEASLTYFKVESGWKSSTYAEKAKYKNAQLYFYTGEFDLSQSMLDILKRATTRAISNDAIDLSIFIKSNSALDTSYDALQLYADADLLVYQKKYNKALATYDELLSNFSNHSLTDEVLWEKAQIYSTTKQINKEIEQLKLLIKNHGDDILADDAVFLLAEVYEGRGETKLAMDYYKSILLDYKGSIYIENARLAYRRLRGN